MSFAVAYTAGRSCGTPHDMSGRLLFVQRVRGRLRSIFRHAAQDLEDTQERCVWVQKGGCIMAHKLTPEPSVQLRTEH